MTDLFSSLASELPSRLASLRQTLEQAVEGLGSSEMRDQINAFRQVEAALHLARNIETPLLALIEHVTTETKD